MDNFQPTGANEPIFLPYRKAGDQFWPSLKKADEIKIATDAIKAQIKKIDEQLAALLTEEQHLGAKSRGGASSLPTDPRANL